MKKVILSLSVLLASYAWGAPVDVAGPDGKLIVSTDVIGGKPVYSITYDGDVIIENSPLGFKSDVGDFTQYMALADSKRGEVNKSYEQDKIKKSHIDYKANTLVNTYKGAFGHEMSVEWQVSDNDVAFRYIIPSQNGGDTGAMVINEEATGYRFPKETTVFLTSQSDAMIGWKRTKPSYEEFYISDAPLDSPSQFGHGFTFPALFRVGDKGWALLSETGVDGYYCASHLSDYKDGVYSIAYPMPEENMQRYCRSRHIIARKDSVAYNHRGRPSCSHCRDNRTLGCRGAPLQDRNTRSGRTRYLELDHMAGCKHEHG